MSATRFFTRPAPSDLSAGSAELWPGLVSDLAAIHKGVAEVDLFLLADTLRARDRLIEVSAKLAEDGVTVVGSRSQTRPHPLLAVERELRREAATGFERLRLAGK